MNAWKAAGSPKETDPERDAKVRAHLKDADDTGIPAIDDAYHHLKPNGHTPRLAFLEAIAYLYREPKSAAGNARARAAATKAAAKKIREAAGLLEQVNNPFLARLLRSSADLAEVATYSVVFPLKLTAEGIEYNVNPDAISATVSAKRGPTGRDANIVKILASFFPADKDFLTKCNGYAMIANLLVLFSPTTKSAQEQPNEYVRSILDRQL